MAETLENMARQSPPPPERFDAITGTWTLPGGPLFDPARSSDAQGEGTVVLVGPVPRELAGDDNTSSAFAKPSRLLRRRWALLAGVGLWVALIIVAANVSSATPAAPWTWAVAAVNLVVALYSLHRSRAGRAER